MKPVTLILALLLGCFQAVAQPRSVGLLLSHTLTGVQVDIASSELARHTITVAARMYGRQPSIVREKGFNISYDCNFPLLSRVSGDGILTLFCGPQVVCGYLKDEKGYSGGSVGLGLALGTEYEFSRHVAIGARLSPSAGFSIKRTSEYASMDFYSSSLLEGIFPQITLKYCFF